MVTPRCAPTSRRRRSPVTSRSTPARTERICEQEGMRTGRHHALGNCALSLGLFKDIEKRTGREHHDVLIVFELQKAFVARD